MKPLPDVVITGPPVVGKGTVCKILLKHGYRSVIDTGALVREELAALGEPSPERNRQGEYASQMIRTYGGGYFVDRLLDSEPGPHIIDGPRRVVEVQHLLNRGAVLLFLDASEERRHEWSSARGTERDRLSFEEFLEKDMLEWGYFRDSDGSLRRHSDPYERNLNHVLPQAHATFANDGSHAELEGMARRFAGDLWEQQVGPARSWGQRAYHAGAPCDAVE